MPTHDMIASRENHIAKYYDRLVMQFGYDARACDASSKASLEVRYKILSEVLDLSGKTILEAGCGFGDLGVYLQNKYKKIHYTGVDISTRMIELGKRINGGLSLRCADIMEVDSSQTVDVVLAQGIFYLLGKNAETKMYKLIEKMYSLATKAVAFSTISQWSKRKSKKEFYANPVKLLQCCKRLTPNLILRHDYHPGDFTLYLYK